MKVLLIFTMFVLLSISTRAQEFQGSWQGSLQTSGSLLNVMIHITHLSEKPQATMDVIEQGVKNINASRVIIDGKQIRIELDQVKAIYTGERTSDSSISGEWQQSGLKLPLKLVKRKHPNFERPQSDAIHTPFPYEINDILFQNKMDSVTLAGTLTMPKDKENIPAVLLISGSGPQNRDSEIFGHKTFEVLSDYLTRNGIAVLRYDDRGVGKSSGDFSTATTFDFANDAAAGLAFLKNVQKVNPRKVGIVGHSEGGLIAEIIASGQIRPDFLVLLSAPAMNIDELMLEQARQIGFASGAPIERINLQVETNAKAFSLLKSGQVTDSTFTKIRDIYLNQIKILAQGNLSENAIQDQADLVMKSFTPWFVTFIQVEPKKYLTKITGPVLAINGGKDLQVSAKQNLATIESILKDKKDVQLTTIELPELNHLFQTCQTGSPSEYSQIKETFSPIALQAISVWILQQ